MATQYTALGAHEMAIAGSQGALRVLRRTIKKQQKKDEHNESAVIVSAAYGPSRGTVNKLS